MKTETAGFLTGMSGIVALLAHPAIVAFTLLGTGLASTPESRVPALSEHLWGISLWGTVVAAIVFFPLMLRWTRMLATTYAVIWILLCGCYWLGCLVSGSALLPFMLMDALLPLASAGCAVYGVWRYRREDRAA